MSINHRFKCLTCNEQVGPTVTQLNCQECGGLFKVIYEDLNMSSVPFHNEPEISLGEGRTPLIALNSTADLLGLENLWAKMEMMAPTGSFKDRGSAVLITMAKNENITEFAEDSSGNAGASMSAYAAAAGMTAHIFVPDSAANGKIDQIKIFGAKLHTIPGPRQASTNAALDFVSEKSVPYLSHNLSPYFSEGMKSFSVELVENLHDDVDHIVMPVGNGSLFIGAWDGYIEMMSQGKVDRAPKFHAIQSQAVRPIVSAVNEEVWDNSCARPTIASGIAVSAPPRLKQCVNVINSSGGSALGIDDNVALLWQRRLAETEGVFCEVTSAIAFAGLEKLLSESKINKSSTVVIPITGTGLKEPLIS